MSEDEKDKGTLFCVVVDQRGRSNLRYVYLHAESRNHARIQYTVMEPNRRTHRIVDVAPVVGYFCDDNGENLTTD